jgi:sugar lactone lactonase YvrE
MRVSMIVISILSSLVVVGATGAHAQTVETAHAGLSSPLGLAMDAAGRLYVGESGRSVVTRIDPNGTRTTVAGLGERGFSGDGGAAASARLSTPEDLAVDLSGNLYIVDPPAARVRRVDARTGLITTVAGTGLTGAVTDGQQATSAPLGFPAGVAVDARGNVYVTDLFSSRLYKVDVAADTITIVAGNGLEGLPNGDGGSAKSARLTQPHGVAIDNNGDIYIAERDRAGRVRKIDAQTGTITTVAGGGSRDVALSPQAVDAHLGEVIDVALDDANHLFITSATRVLHVDLDSGALTVAAGTGVAGDAGDGGPGAQARVDGAFGVVVSGAGDVLFADTNNGRVRTVPVREPPAFDVIVDLTTTQSFLDVLTAVRGDLLVIENAGRQQLVLLNLESVGGDFVVATNPDLTLIRAPELRVVNRDFELVGGDRLVTVDLPNLARIEGDLTVERNPALGDLTLPLLTHVGGNMSAGENAALETIDLPLVNTVEGDISVVRNQTLTSFLAPVLARTGGVSVSHNEALVDLLFPELAHVAGQWSFDANGKLRSVGAPALVDVEEDVVFASNPELDEITMPLLQRVNGAVTVEDDAALEQVELPLLSHAGSVSVIGNPSLLHVAFERLAESGQVRVVNNAALSSIDAPELTQVAGDVVLSDNAALETIELPLVNHVDGDVVLTNDPNADAVDLPLISTVGGDVVIEDNLTLTTLDLPLLTSVGGDLSLRANPTLGEAELPNLTTVQGNAVLETTVQARLDLSRTIVGGNLDVVGVGLEQLAANTARGQTQVTLANTRSVLDVVLPQAAFSQPTAFTVASHASLPAEPGRDDDGSSATLTPLAGYKLRFATAVLANAATVTEEVSVDALGAQGPALVAAVANGTAKLAVKSDAPGAAYQATPLCRGTQQPTANGCARVSALAADGVTPATGNRVKIVRFEAKAPHFSTWSVVLVRPAAAASTCNLEGYWQFDSVAAGRTLDVIAQRPAQLLGNARLATGFRGQGIALNGDGLVRLPAMLHTAPRFTASLFVQADTGAASTVLAADEGRAPPRAWIGYEPASKVGFMSALGGASLTTGVQASAGTWTHLAVSYAAEPTAEDANECGLALGASRKGLVKLYVGGALRRCMRATNEGAAEALLLGASKVTGAANKGDFRGTLDEVALFRGTVPAAGIARIAAGLPTSTELRRLVLDVAGGCRS